MRIVVGVLAGSISFASNAAGAAECNNPDALGTSRTLAISPTEYGRVGTMQYKRTLPLADHEVVLTFDDGPIPPNTTRILQTLASECVKATFFLVGRHARAFPHLARRVHEEGHTIATHSQNHPMNFAHLSQGRLSQEIEGGIAATAAALGKRSEIAPFFRIPGLGRSPHNEAFLAAHGLSVWSADFAADDWTHISAQKVLDRALKRLDRKGKGILLLHDIQPATALALPRLLRELKARGYRVVHVVPRGPARPKPQPQSAPDQIVMDMPRRPAWPTVNEAAPLQLPYARAEDLHWPQRLAMTYAAHPVEIPLAEPLVAWPVEPDAAFTWPAVEPDGSKRSEIHVEPDPVNFGFASMPGEITAAPLPAIAAGFAPSGGKPAEMVYPVFALEPLLKVQAAQNH